MSKKKQTLLNLTAYVVAPFLIGIGNIFKMRVFITELGALQNGIYQFYFALLIYFEVAENSMDMAMYSFLYKYIVGRKYEKINSLIAGGKVYWSRFGFGYLLIGLLFLPLAPFIVGNQPTLLFVVMIHILYAVRGTFNYFFAGPQTLALADNRGYLVITINALMTLTGAIGAIVIAYTTKNLIYAVIFEVLTTLVFTIFKYMYLKKQFPFLDMQYTKKQTFEFKALLPGTLTTKITETLINNSDIFLVTLVFGAMVNSGFAIFISFATLLISVFGVSVMTSMQSLLGKYFEETGHDALTKQNSIRLLKWFNYIVIAIVVPLIALALNPFIGWFYGANQMAGFVFYLVLIIFIYVRLFRTPYTTLKISTGHYNVFVPYALADALCKIVLSLSFAYVFGVYGVLLGTIISYLLTEFWLEAKEFDIKILHKKWSTYFMEISSHFAITMALSLALYWWVSPLITGFARLLIICMLVGVCLSILVIGTSVAVSPEIRAFIQKYLRKNKKM